MRYYLLIAAVGVALGGWACWAGYLPWTSYAVKEAHLSEWTEAPATSAELPPSYRGFIPELLDGFVKSEAGQNLLKTLEHQGKVQEAIPDEMPTKRRSLAAMLNALAETRTVKRMMKPIKRQWALRPWIINIYSSDPNERIKELLNNSEDLRQIQEEWKRIWWEDHPKHLTPEKVDGAIQ